jgi:hypothetical protein
VSNLGMRNSNAKFIDFGFLQGSIKKKPTIMPTNLDMVLCKNGNKFLIAEWKHDTEVMPLGQKIVLKGLAEQNNFTVLIIYGHSDDAKLEVNSFYQVQKDHLKYIDNGIDALKQYINEWWESN